MSGTDQHSERAGSGCFVGVKGEFREIERVVTRTSPLATEIPPASAFAGVENDRDRHFERHGCAVCAETGAIYYLPLPAAPLCQRPPRRSPSRNQ
jgi:hypothetical protein